MPRAMEGGLALVALVALVPPVAVSAGAAGAGAVSWKDAGRHVGRLVAIEGFVRAAEREGRHVTLRFDPADPSALTVTLLVPVLTDLPPDPELLYRRRRVRAYGRVTRTAGRLEMVVTDPDRIEIEGLVPPAPATERPPARPPGGAPSPARRAEADRSALACARLVARREAARVRALGAADALRACLSAARGSCASEADAVADPIARLEALDRTVRARCPAER